MVARTFASDLEHFLRPIHCCQIGGGDLPLILLEVERGFAHLVPGPRLKGRDQVEGLPVGVGPSE